MDTESNSSKTAGEPNWTSRAAGGDYHGPGKAPSASASPACREKLAVDIPGLNYGVGNLQPGLAFAAFNDHGVRELDFA